MAIVRTDKEERAIPDNRVIAFMGPRKLEVQSVEFPKLVGPGGRKCDHGAILKIVSTNICGSDQHIYHGRFARG
jgi:glutathione-independent formaldehyde dehydrogenase